MITDTTEVAPSRTRKAKKEVLSRGIRRRGSSLYAYLTHVDGKYELRRIGNVTPEFAKRQRAVWQREIEESRYVKPKPRTDMVLFSDICDKAVEYHKNYTRSWDAIEGRTKVFKAWWPGRTAESIGYEEIEKKLLDNLAPNGLKWSPTTSNEYRVSLICIFRLAIKRKELTANPALATQRHKIDNARIRELTYTEQDALRAVIAKRYPHKLAEFDLGLHLMCRHSNIYGQHNGKRQPMDPLQWRDVNMDFRTVTFRRSKSGKAYVVPVNDTAFAALEVLRERCDDPAKPEGQVVRKPSGLELQSSRRWFEKCLTEAKVADFRWHDLRHTAASRLRNAHAQIEDIRYLLGHGAKSITERYAHPSIDVLRQVIGLLDQRPQTGTNTVQPNILQFRTA